LALGETDDGRARPNFMLCRDRSGAGTRNRKPLTTQVAESIAKGKRLTKKTQELVAKAHGKPLGREMLEWTSIRLMQLA